MNLSHVSAFLPQKFFHFFKLKKAKSTIFDINNIAKNTKFDIN